MIQKVLRSMLLNIYTCKYNQIKDEILKSHINLWILNPNVFSVQHKQTREDCSCVLII